jgi:hypothetical protein
MSESNQKSSVQRLRDLCRIAGPDDPIYQGGLVMTSLRRPQAPELSCQDQKEIVDRMRRDPKYKQM